MASGTSVAAGTSCVTTISTIVIGVAGVAEAQPTRPTLTIELNNRTLALISSFLLVLVRRMATTTNAMPPPTSNINYKVDPALSG